MYVDRNNNIWVGTSGAGLVMFDNNKHTLVSFVEEDGLSNALISKILEDETGRLWLSTNNGISSFDPKSRKFKSYSFQNGLQRSMFYMGAGIKTSQGELFFGGFDGFNYFDPRLLRCNKNIPALAFTDLRISNRSVIPGNNSPIKEHISVASKISLGYKQNFSLEFAALNYTSPLENRYAYKMDGLDKQWNDVGSLHTASYMNLAPGTYTFRVRAKSDDGMWNSPEKTITIFVKPPFWRTIYAYIFYVVAAVLLIALIRYRTIHKIKNRFAQEQERLQFQRMLEEEKRERERQREFDELKIKFITNLSHEFRTPISLIMAPVEKLITQEASIDKQSQLSLVKRNTQRLLTLVNQLLDFRKLEENELKLNLSEGDIISFARDIADSFKDIAEAKQVQFSFSSTVTSYLTRFDHDKIERVLLNVLSNAFKFTGKKGEIKLKIEHSAGSNIKIVVSDSGIGMSQEVQQKIFDRFFQGDDNRHVLNQGSGIGLSIVKEFVKLHEGTIALESKAGQGSTFIIELPFKVLASAVETSETHINGGNNHSPLQPARSENDPLSKLTVLLVEDNDEFRHYLRDHLKDYYRIVEACDGREGWRKTLSSHPHIVVSDISMPGIDGITLSRKIKSDKRTRHIPVILLTALTGHANHINGLQTGASDYLTKPFNFDILNVKIRNLVLLNQNLKETYNKQLKVEPSEVVVEGQDNKLLTQVIKYIEANIDSPDLTVEELSRQVLMSRGSLYNKIVELTGETPVEFIRSIKLKKAAALLEKSDMRISQVGYMVGFSSPNYFAKMFREKFNMSPSEYAIHKRGHANQDPVSN
jgi:signal transduction histidine kinase/DNA-binding response OmpR family regulator